MVLNVLMQDAMVNPPTVQNANMWADAYGLSFPVLVDAQGLWQDLYLEPGEEFASYLIDRDGVVVWREFGESLETYDRAEAEILSRL